MSVLSWGVLLLRVFLGAVFVVSGFEKLTSPAENFAAVIEKFGLLPAWAVPWLAHTLPWAEFLSGVFFLAGLWTRLSLFSLWAMNSVFIAVLSQALWRRLPIEECGCFGKALTLSPVQMLGVDAVFWVLFLLFFLAQKKADPLSLDRMLDARG